MDVPPLSQRRILVTRTRQQASELAARLESLGASAILIPTIEIVPPESYSALDTALSKLDRYNWLLFTSANAVEVFHRRWDRVSIPPRIAVIGPATAHAVESLGLRADLIPERYVAESLASELAPYAAKSRMLLVRAAEARDVLPETLRAAGAEVTIAEAYRNQIPAGSVVALQSLFADASSFPDAITFTSSSTARNLFTLLEAGGIKLPEKIIRASIGPITSQTLHELGHPPHVEAASHTIPALVQSLVVHFAA
ncbi:hypothetical protein GCM10011507_06230 [Edaphobacter acidisoli]|uniref:Uroporphyrinogen-III synthase n=1 Tax=Edaphobacter acidisoli TaxID=2040573 RepID=A0A916W0R9_9BACT|nr:uroporphyrinogen-III synthase [Edaphobacter acidisoli]GGA57614.1 hypothetical protein GCM10011507_06230 [Edaphobacter acidisoli]